MKKEKVFGAILLIIPVLFVIGFILKNTKFWVGVDVVVFLITGIIGLSLLLKRNQ